MEAHQREDGAQTRQAPGEIEQALHEKQQLICVKAKVQKSEEAEDQLQEKFWETGTRVAEIPKEEGRQFICDVPLNWKPHWKADLEKLLRGPDVGSVTNNERLLIDIARP